MYRIYNFIKKETICQYDTLRDILIFINEYVDIPFNHCFIQYYDGDLNNWYTF